MVGLAELGRTDEAHANASRLCWPLPRRCGSPRGEGTCLSSCGAAALPRVQIRLAANLAGRGVPRRMAAAQRARTVAQKCLVHQGHPRVMGSLVALAG